MDRPVKKAKHAMNVPLALEVSGSSVLSLTIAAFPRLLQSDELAAASQTCKAVHHVALEETTRRWKALGWGDYQPIFSFHPQMPKGLETMGIFSRVTASRVLEGLVVAAQGDQLCSRLTAMGAKAVKTDTFSQSLQTENIDFCVWTGSSPPPTKKALDAYYDTIELAPPLSSRPIVMWELMLMSFLFSPWVSTKRTLELTELTDEVSRGYMQPVGLSDEETAELHSTDFSLREDCFQPWEAMYLTTHTNIACGDVVREWEGVSFHDTCIEHFYHQNNAEEESQPLARQQICGGDDCPVLDDSWTKSEADSQSSSESEWVRAVLSTLIAGWHLHGYPAPYLFNNTWLQDWSSTTPVCVGDRARQWRDCLRVLKTTESLRHATDDDGEDDQFFLSCHEGGCIDREVANLCVPGEAVLRWAWAKSFDVFDDWEGDQLILERLETL